jgi:hypothetical protein
MITLTPEQRQEIDRQGHLRIDDGAYVVVKAEAFDRLRSVLEGGPLTIEEQRAALAHAGKRAGWDDPALDVYNDLDPRR